MLVSETTAAKPSHPPHCSCLMDLRDGTFPRIGPSACSPCSCGGAWCHLIWSPGPAPDVPAIPCQLMTPLAGQRMTDDHDMHYHHGSGGLHRLFLTVFLATIRCGSSLLTDFPSLVGHLMHGALVCDNPHASTRRSRRSVLGTVALPGMPALAGFCLNKNVTPATIHA